MRTAPEEQPRAIILLNSFPLPTRGIKHSSLHPSLPVRILRGLIFLSLSPSVPTTRSSWWWPVDPPVSQQASRKDLNPTPVFPTAATESDDNTGLNKGIPSKYLKVFATAVNCMHHACCWDCFSASPPHQHFFI